MAAIGTLPIPRVRVSTIEIDHPANPYTFETIARLGATYGPGAELYFIIGSDSFEEMHTWRRPDLILSQCNLIVAARPGYGMCNKTLAVLLGLTSEAGTAEAKSGVASSSSLPLSGQPGEVLDRAGITAGQPGRIIDMTGDRKQAVPRSEERGSGLIFLTDYINADVSSTEVRRRAASNIDIQALVPGGVSEYIRKYELYKAGTPAGIQ